jgi:hypothetical protein
MRYSFFIFSFLFILSSCIENGINNKNIYSKDTLQIVKSELKCDCLEVKRISIELKKKIPLNKKNDSLIRFKILVENQKSNEIKKRKKINDGIDFNPCKINKKLPFGPSELLSYRFPDNGFTIDKIADSLHQVHFKEFFSIWTFYLKEINKTDCGDVDCQNYLPRIYELDKINIDGKYIESESINAYKTISEDIKMMGIPVDYRLTNIGQYQTYYTTDYVMYSESQKEPFLDSTSFNYPFRGFENQSYGMIFLYNPSNYKAKVIPVFTFIETSDGFIFRFFYITKDKKIKIYEGYSKEYAVRKITDQEIIQYYKYDITIKEHFEIVVLKNGEIKIIKQNKEN